VVTKRNVTRPREARVAASCGFSDDDPLRPRTRRTAARVSLASTRSNPGGSAGSSLRGSSPASRRARASDVSAKGWGRPGDAPDPL